MDAATRQRVAAEIDFRTFTERDVAGISQLITEMSATGPELRLRDKSPAYYRWMYFTNPAGPAFGCLARHGDRIVASFAIAPKVVQVGGRRRLLGKTMDMFTDPDYQGLGLMGRCAERVFTDARAAGVEGWYVTPSPNSYPIFTRRWGYREDFGLVFRARVLDAPAVVTALRPALGPLLRPVARVLGRRRRAARAPRLPTGWTAEPLAALGREVDALWDAVGPGHRVAVVRDAAYLTWRYCDHPDDYALYGLHQHGTLCGLIVLKTTTRHGVRVCEVVDLVAPVRDPRVVNLLLRVAVAHARREGCAVVEAWSIPGTWLDRRFVWAGLAIPRARLPFLLSPDAVDPLLGDPDAWLLTQGDGNDV